MKVVLEANHAKRCMQIEAEYVDVNTTLGHALQKAMALKGAIANLELKVMVAVADFEQEVKTIEQNFAKKA